MGRVVLLDDQERLLRTLARLLEAAGHEVVAGQRFAEVDDRLWPGRFDVLVSDILMPGLSGIDVLRKLGERGCQEPVVLITGEPNVDTASDAVRLGAFDYIPKPVTKQKLLDVVERALRHVTVLRERDEARESKMRVLENLARIGENAAMLVHEVKAPVTALNHALRLVSAQLGVDEQEVLREHVGRLERLQDLMKRTLAYARPISRGDGHFQLQPLTTRVVRTFQAMPGNREVRLDLHFPDAPVDIDGDEQWLEELLMNLLLNARRAAGPKLHVRVRVTVGSQGICTLEVGDDGPGIPSDRRREVLQPFSTSDEEGGSGLGLAIVVKIAEAFGGAVQVGEDPELGGALLRITLMRRRLYASRDSWSTTSEATESKGEESSDDGS
jgi:signal transduction histidine kinase